MSVSLEIRKLPRFRKNGISVQDFRDHLYDFADFLAQVMSSQSLFGMWKASRTCWG